MGGINSFDYIVNQLKSYSSGFRASAWHAANVK